MCTDFGTIAEGSACNDDRDCDTGDCCDPDGLTCAACGAAGSIADGDSGCVDDSECDSGDYCASDGTCTADPYASDEGSEDLGGTCYEDADCASGDYCDEQDRHLHELASPRSLPQAEPRWGRPP